MLNSSALNSKALNATAGGVIVLLASAAFAANVSFSGTAAQQHSTNTAFIGKATLITSADRWKMGDWSATSSSSLVLNEPDFSHGSFTDWVATGEFSVNPTMKWGVRPTWNIRVNAVFDDTLTSQTTWTGHLATGTLVAEPNVIAKGLTAWNGTADFRAFVERIVLSSAGFDAYSHFLAVPDALFIDLTTWPITGTYEAVQTKLQPLKSQWSVDASLSAEGTHHRAAELSWTAESVLHAETTFQDATDGVWYHESWTGFDLRFDWHHTSYLTTTFINGGFIFVNSEWELAGFRTRRANGLWTQDTELTVAAGKFLSGIVNFNVNATLDFEYEATRVGQIDWTINTNFVTDEVLTRYVSTDLVVSSVFEMDTLKGLGARGTWPIEVSLDGEYIRTAGAFSDLVGFGVWTSIVPLKIGGAVADFTATGTLTGNLVQEHAVQWSQSATGTFEPSPTTIQVATLNVEANGYFDANAFIIWSSTWTWNATSSLSGVPVGKRSTTWTVNTSSSFVLEEATRYKLAEANWFGSVVSLGIESLYRMMPAPESRTFIVPPINTQFVVPA